MSRTLVLLALLAVTCGVAVGLTARLNRPVVVVTGRVPASSDHPVWRQRHAEFVAASRAGNLDVICLGDSLTWGWDDHRDLWAARVTPRPTGFFAIGGDTTSHILWRVENGELDGPPPKLVWVMAGTNNRWLVDDPDDIAESVGEIVRRVRAKVPTAKVLVLGVFPQGARPSASSRAMFAEVNRRLPALADGKAVFFRDIGGCLLEPDGTLSDEVSYDETHLTRVGHERLAEALRPILRELLGDTP